MFEKSVENTKIDSKLEILTLNDDIYLKNNQDISKLTLVSSSQVTYKESTEAFEAVAITTDNGSIFGHTPNTENMYRTDMLKDSFLKSQLLGNTETDTGKEFGSKVNSHIAQTELNPSISKTEADLTQEFNVTDDTRLAHSSNQSQPALLDNGSTITIPPRRKKRPSIDNKVNSDDEKTTIQTNHNIYPDHLNPFSEDDEEVFIVSYLLFLLPCGLANKLRYKIKAK